MEESRRLIGAQHFQLMIDRLCHQLLEVYDDFADTCMIGVQHRGVLFANRLYERLGQIADTSQLQYGKVDITFYRDDFRQKGIPLRASTTEMDFLVEAKRVLLVDDVLYTGRTIQAALTALQHYGRPTSLELIALVDRRYNRHLPIQADFVGLTVDAIDDAYVKVQWKPDFEEDSIWLYPHKEGVKF